MRIMELHSMYVNGNISRKGCRELNHSHDVGRYQVMRKSHYLGHSLEADNRGLETSLVSQAGGGGILAVLLHLEVRHHLLKDQNCLNCLKVEILIAILSLWIGFLSILEKVKSSDKPKLAFNANVVPEFDPLSKDQTIITWITKVEECAEIYGWEEREIIHYSMPKLCGVAKTWYQGLTSVLHTWPEWKKKLLESFPCREDYAELLTEMLAKKVKYGESLEHYYYAKINLLNRCNISGKQAVDCLLYGVEDRAVKVGAQAAQFRDPKQVLKYFKTVKIGQSRDNQDIIRRGSFGINTNRADSSRANNPAIKCFSCNEIGHPSFRCGKTVESVKCHNCNEIGHRSTKCEKPFAKCTTCNKVGHLTSNCYKNTGRFSIETGKDLTSANDPKHKQVSEVTCENTGINKYVMDIKVNGSVITCHVDLGSQCSLIRASDARSLGLTMINRDNLPTLRGIGASMVKPLGIVIATVEVQGVAETINLYVVDDYVLVHPVLLGHSFTEKPDILIIKTPDSINIHRMPPNKINLVASQDYKIPCSATQAVQVFTDAQLINCEVDVKGTRPRRRRVLFTSWLLQHQERSWCNSDL